MSSEGMPIPRKLGSPERPTRLPVNSTPATAAMTSAATPRVSGMANASVATSAPIPPTESTYTWAAQRRSRSSQKGSQNEVDPA